MIQKILRGLNSWREGKNIKYELVTLKKKKLFVSLYEKYFTSNTAAVKEFPPEVIFIRQNEDFPELKTVSLRFARR